MDNKYIKYLGIKHDYLNNNCITLVELIYKQELNSNIFDIVWNYLKMPNGRPKEQRMWIKKYSLELLENSAKLIATKVNLTEIQEYDLIIFNAGRLIPTHFGMYVGNNKFIHLEEGKHSKIDPLNEFWRERIASIWRRNGINM